MDRNVSKKSMPSMTKSDLVKVLAKNQSYLAARDVEVAVNSLIDILSNSLSAGERIEIRGFGSFNLHYHPSRSGRNPRTGEPANVSGKYIPHLKPGKELRKRVL